MSHASSSSDGGHEWPNYGPVPLARYPNCPRLEPLVSLRCKRTENGNYGWKFVKCESEAQPGNVHIATFLSILCLICTESGLFWWFRF
jgi:hypothetical protein